MNMETREQIAVMMRELHEVQESWRDHWAKVEIELNGAVPDAVFQAHVRLEAIKREPELWKRFTELTTDFDILRTEMDMRMVEAHEWMLHLRAETS